MESVVLVIHLILALAIIAVVLIQPSEGGMGSMGGGSALSGLTTAKGAANFLTRLTAILVTCFIITSLTLAILAGRHSSETSIVDMIPATEQAVQPAEIQQEPDIPISQ